MLALAMAKTVIVSESTIRDLLEAHASLSAWYYELSAALRAAGGTCPPPDDPARAAFVERLTNDFPELATVVKSIGIPRAYVPPPPSLSARQAESATGDEQTTVMEPAQARLRGQGAGASAGDGEREPD
jgi:hypothetical protein